jgi:hypothetical protein
LPSPSPSDIENHDENASSALRAAFWRYYDWLGRLTLLSVLWTSTLMLAVYAGFRAGSSGASPIFRAGVGLAVFTAASVLSAGFGRAAFGTFIEGRFDFSSIARGMRRFSFRLAVLGLLVTALGGVSMNALVMYLHLARSGTAWAYGPAFVAASFLTALALSSVWLVPVLFFRDDPAWKALWRSFLLLVGHPGESLVMTLGTLGLLYLYWRAPATGLLLGFPLLLVVPCTMLEKIQWGYTITFEGMDGSKVEERWRREESRGWREFFKPWEGR